MILPFVIHKDAGDVLRVVKIAHGRKRNHHHAVVIVVAALNFMLVDADYLEAQAVDANALPQSLFAGKESALGLIADDGHAGVLHEVLFAHGASAGNIKTANALVNRINPGEIEIGESARVVLDGCTILVEDGSDAFNHRHFVANVIDVGQLQPHFTASFRAARLQGGASRECSDHISSPGAENHGDGA